MPKKPITIPISLVGPGSQPDSDPANTLGLPETIEIFEMPRTPEASNQETAIKCRELFIDMYNEMLLWNIDGGEAGPAFALNKYDLETLKLINQLLGEGEVQIRVKVKDEKFDEILIQESIFVGVWRVKCYKDGKPISDQIEVGAIPICVAEAAYIYPQEKLFPVEPGPDAMNSPAILAELGTAIKQWKPGSPAFTVNLSHLPMSPADNEVVDKALGEGAVHMVSSGYGNCHISTTGVRHVWRIQYLNNSPAKLLVLNTVVVTGMPDEAIAASEDLHDSTQRIKDLIDWVSKSWELPPVELK